MFNVTPDASTRPGQVPLGAAPAVSYFVQALLLALQKHSSELGYNCMSLALMFDRIVRTLPRLRRRLDTDTICHCMIGALAVMEGCVELRSDTLLDAPTSLHASDGMQARTVDRGTVLHSTVSPHIRKNPRNTFVTCWSARACPLKQRYHVAPTQSSSLGEGHRWVLSCLLSYGLLVCRPSCRFASGKRGRPPSPPSSHVHHPAPGSGRNARGLRRGTSASSRLARSARALAISKRSLSGRGHAMERVVVEQVKRIGVEQLSQQLASALAG